MKKGYKSIICERCGKEEVRWHRENYKKKQTLTLNRFLERSQVN